ncbi:MAG: preprotein translocase subunit SecY [Gammaproteobacteria bacterium]|nr:preprotein translocase subunit SecY [Gammaproteobacteria bacterium]
MAKTPAQLGGGSMGRFSELRQRLVFLLLALVIYRLGVHITIPGVDASVMAQIFEQQRGTFLGVFNIFSGGALEKMSLFSLGVMPYISASIIIQMLSHVHGPWIELRKEGESGRRKLTQYTRWFTVILATVQAVGIAMNLPKLSPGLVPVYNGSFVFTAAITLITGTMFLMWLGEQITERGIGNGISMLIFAGIVAGLPTSIANLIQQASNGEISSFVVILIFVMVAAVTYGVVFVERSQRRIQVHYARQQHGNRTATAQSSYFPLKLNMAGVIPPIFASSIILFPATIGQWFAQGEGMGWLRDAVAVLSPGQPIYIALYAFLIIFFCFFYTALVFDSRETADNLKKQGALIQGIRPGDQTARYIDSVMTRLTLIGAIYITTVCLLPEILILFTSVQFYFGGTSLLIVVVVLMDFMAQVQAHLLSHQYESLLKKANFKGLGGAGLPR